MPTFGDNYSSNEQVLKTDGCWVKMNMKKFPSEELIKQIWELSSVCFADFFVLSTARSPIPEVKNKQGIASNAGRIKVTTLVIWLSLNYYST